MQPAALKTCAHSAPTRAITQAAGTRPAGTRPAGIRPAGIRPAGIRRAGVGCWILLFSIILGGCGRTPDLGSAEAFRAADALYTAVTSRRVNLLDDVRQQLARLKADGQLSDAASGELDAIMQLARSDQWQAAAEQLDILIRNQPARPHRHQ